jgi:hypothetical protein
MIMENKLKKTIKLFYSGVFVLALLAVFCGSTTFQKVNFSGIWKVDTLKSNYGGYGPAAAAVTLKIVQAKDTISIERTIHPGRGVARSFTDKLPLDGKAITNTKGTTKSSVSIKWSGQTLVETSSYRDDKFNKTYQATETWTLSPDGKTLTIDRVVANDGEGGHGASKAVYHRA